MIIELIDNLQNALEKEKQRGHELTKPIEYKLNYEGVPKKVKDIFTIVWTKRD